MAEPAPKRGMTVAEFLAYDDGTDLRYELVGGEMVAMNPPAEPHVRITFNLFEALSRRLTRPCRAYFGGGVWIDVDDHTWREPDIVVAGREGDGFSREPCLVVEVLSPSTEKEDRTRKLDFYRRFASLESMMLVWQDTRRVELHERTHAGWLVRDVIGSGAIALPTLRVEISLDEIYA